MATAMLDRARTRPSQRRRAETTAVAAAHAMDEQNRRVRLERKLDQRIEYIASDWSSVPSAEHSVVDAAEARRLSADGGGRSVSAHELLEASRGAPASAD